MKSLLGANKLERVPWPYYWLTLPDDKQLGGGDWVIFFGTDFHSMTEADTEAFIKKTNQCLEYIRKNCTNCRLIYRIHPDEKKETALLDLRSFSIEAGDLIAEDYLWLNRGKIRYVFSVCSAASVTGFNLGLNSYCFYTYFHGVFRGEYRLFTEHYMSGMPAKFFIDNLEKPLIDNKISLVEDKPLRSTLESIMSKNTGTVWFVVSENRYLLAIIALVNLIRTLVPEKHIGLILSKHHRWTDDRITALNDIFDKVMIFPRTFYSLKPLSIISCIRIAKKVKAMDFEAGSVLMGFAYHDFLENCLVSYHPEIFKIAFLPEIAWRLHFRTKEIGFKTEKFKFNKASFFYSWIFEPLLHLNRTMFRHYGDDSNIYFIRLKKNIEDIYDKVFLIKNAPIDQNIKYQHE